jgi:two-component system response regulator FlrC
MTKETRVLVADDDPNMQLAIKAALQRGGFDTTIVSDGRAALERIENDHFDIIISDQRMPEMTGQELLANLRNRGDAPPLVLITAHGTITQAVEAMQQGAADFLMKPFSSEELIRIVERVLSPEAQSFREKPARARKGRPIVTNDPLMIRVLEVCEAVARSDATVLVAGESGTGKELIARLIHSASPRAAMPFVAVNCAALPATLLESELFGHEKGAFTGAQTKKIGKFELAQGGTILLDEISEMDILLQAKLLRVLQEREVDRVGGREPVSIDVRVVATTNRNLEEAVRRGQFRADLYYRLNVIPVTLPSLRERRGDIRLLAKHFMKQYLGEHAPELTDDVVAMLDTYSWPGNVRELQNAIERAGILARGNAPQRSDFLLTSPNAARVAEQLVERSPESPMSSVDANVQPQGQNAIQSGTFSIEVTRGENSVNPELQIRAGTTVEAMERSLILETLKSTRWNRTEAAKMLGISIRTLRNKLHDYRGAGFIEHGFEEAGE